MYQKYWKAVDIVGTVMMEKNYSIPYGIQEILDGHDNDQLQVLRELTDTDFYLPAVIRQYTSEAKEKKLAGNIQVQRC